MAEDKTNEKVTDEKLRDIAGGTGEQSNGPSGFWKSESESNKVSTQGYWTCKCGRANLNSDIFCTSCGECRISLS